MPDISSMVNVYTTYKFNFDETSPQPPMISPSIRALAVLKLVFNCVGILLSSTTIVLILRRKLYEKYSQVLILLTWNVIFNVVTVTTIATSLYFGRVPSMPMCQWEGLKASPSISSAVLK